MRPRPLFITSSTNKLIKMNGQLHLEPSEVSLIFRLYIILYMHRVIVQSETLECRTCYDFIMLCVCSFFFCSIFFSPSAYPQICHVLHFADVGVVGFSFSKK